MHRTRKLAQVGLAGEVVPGRVQAFRSPAMPSKVQGREDLLGGGLLQRAILLGHGPQVTVQRVDPSRVQRGFWDLFCCCFGSCMGNGGERTPLINENKTVRGETIEDYNPFAEQLKSVREQFEEIQKKGGAVYTKGIATVAVLDEGSQIRVAGADSEGVEYSGAMQFSIKQHGKLLSFGGFDAKPQRSGLGVLMLKFALAGRTAVERVQAENVTGSYGFYERLGFLDSQQRPPSTVAQESRKRFPLFSNNEEMERNHVNIGHFSVDRDQIDKQVLQWIPQNNNNIDI